MATNINQIDDADANHTTLQVSGELFLADARLIEQIARTLIAETGCSVTVDVADVDLLDSESAPVLKQLESEGVFELSGIEIFVQAIVNEVERG